MVERALVCVVTGIAIGTLGGWLLGRSDAGPTAIAAAIPAILSVAGSFLVAQSLRGDAATGGYAAVFIVAFCVTFALSVIRTTEMRDAAVEHSIVASFERHIELLFDCTDTERFINEYRENSGLEPLSFQEVCPLAEGQRVLGAVIPDP